MHSDRRLIVCEWCLKYMRKWTTFVQHMVCLWGGLGRMSW